MTVVTIRSCVAGTLCLLAGCQSHCPRPCISGETRPHPIYVDPQGFRSLKRQVECLNHRFAPFETAMDRTALPKCLCKRLIRVDNDLQHVNAAVFSREIAPEKIQRQIDRVALELCCIEAETGIAAGRNSCCKSRRTMAGSLEADLARAMRQNTPGLLSKYRGSTQSKTPNPVGDQLDADADQQQPHEPGERVHPMRVQPPRYPAGSLQNQEGKPCH